MKPLSEFGKNCSRPDGLQAKCKKCDREHKNKKYKENPSLHIKLSHQGRQRKKDWYENIKKQLSCSKCGDKRWYILDFHHTEDKLISISEAVANNWSKKRILEEMKKCIPLCANCHAELHYFEKTGN